MMALLVASTAGGWAVVSLVARVRGGVALDLVAVLAVVGFAAAVGLSARRAA